MIVQNKELYQVWVMRLSIVIAIIVVLLSWINGLRFFELIVRAGVSFGVMYSLMAGSLNLFEKTAPQEPQNNLPDLASGRGGNIDFSVGDDEYLGPQGQDAVSGQIDRNLSSELPDSERQAEIVRRMGWD